MEIQGVNIKKAVEVIHGQVSFEKRYRSAVDKKSRIKICVPPPIFPSSCIHIRFLHYHNPAVKPLRPQKTADRENTGPLFEG